MVESDLLGGTCVNRGCVPKKILWSAGNLARSIHLASRQCIASATAIDFPALIAKRDEHIGAIRESLEQSLDDAGVTLCRGEATLLDAHTVGVASRSYTADNVVLATGGKPTPLDIEGANLLSDSRDVLSWTSLPRRVVIAGGGYIGCEFAAIFNALGVDTTLVHDGPFVLDTFPEGMARHVQAGLLASGITVLTDDGLRCVAENGRFLEYSLTSGESGHADVVVAAVGRSPNVEQLGSFADSIERSQSGALSITDQFETSCAGVYAIGDVADRLPLTPVATADGATLAHILHGEGVKGQREADQSRQDSGSPDDSVASECARDPRTMPIDLKLVATTAFTYPPASFVGTVSDDPDESKRAGEVTPLSQNVLAPQQHYKPAFYRLGFNPETAELTGAQLVCESAPDLIAMAAAMVAARTQASTFSTATAIHPSFAEEFFSEARQSS